MSIGVIERHSLTTESEGFPERSLFVRVSIVSMAIWSMK
jgi:hypothetical protein